MWFSNRGRGDDERINEKEVRREERTSEDERMVKKKKVTTAHFVETSARVDVGKSK